MIATGGYLVLNEHDFVHEETHIDVTISIGAAAWNEEAISTREELIATADNRLYKAKAGGRNLVVHED